MSRRGRRIFLVFEKNEERKDHSFDKKGCGLFAISWLGRRRPKEDGTTPIDMVK